MKKSIILFISLLLFSCSQRTVKSITYGEKVYVPSHSEADFMITMQYRIPNVISDKDSFYFKTCQSETIEYSDGTSESTEFIADKQYSGSCGDGKSGGFNSFSGAKATKEGVEIDLSISWNRESSGEIEKHFCIPWNDLPKTVKDESNNLTVKIERKELKSQNSTR